MLEDKMSDQIDTRTRNAPVHQSLNAEEFLKLGINYSTGQLTPPDMVSAHKWFNIAAMLGSKDAIRLRHEVAEEMLPGEIAAAQRAARAWFTRH